MTLDHPRSRGHYGLIGLFFLLLTVAVALFAVGPRNAGDKVVIFVSPFASPEHVLEVISDADGALVGMGRRSWIAFSISDNPNFVTRLYRAGALFVGSAEAFSACLPAQLLRREVP